ncbi:MAG: hypothetical protein Q8M47_15230, partial [Devosia sp.]|nr:hypothetical protein [Devosia sp.]
GQTWVPIDDTHCWIYCYAWNPERALTAQERDRFASGFSIYATVDEDYKPMARRDNDYNIDREAQKRGSFTGISGVSEQDAAIQDSQGFIADRTREHLGPTDMGIVRFRRLILQAAKDLADKGTQPVARLAPGAYAVRSGGTVAPASEGLSAIMSERFGHPLGWIGKQHGLDDGMIPHTADADADQ